MLKPEAPRSLYRSPNLQISMFVDVVVFFSVVLLLYTTWQNELLINTMNFPFNRYMTTLIYI
jgi:hypothetical protein